VSPLPQTRPSTEPIAQTGEPDHHAHWTVQRHLRGVWRYLTALGCTAEDAEDLAQDAFVTAWSKGAGDLEPAALGAFLRRTARFLFLRRMRGRGLAAERLVAEVDELWDERCASDEGDGLLDAVRQCRGELRGRSKAVLDLTYDQGMSRRDAAAALGMAEDGIKTLLQRTRAALRECVRRWQAWSP